MNKIDHLKIVFSKKNEYFKYFFPETSSTSFRSVSYNNAVVAKRTYFHSHF